MTSILELADKKEAVLKAKAQALGVSAEQYAQQVLDRDLAEDSQQSVSAMFREIWSDMPDKVRAKLPADGANQIDHYVYGVPKEKSVKVVFADTFYRVALSDPADPRYREALAVERNLAGAKIFTTGWYAVGVV